MENAPESNRSPPRRYRVKMCRFFERGLCPRGDDCNFAHDVKDLQAPPSLLKTRLCQEFKKGTCPHPAEMCTFAHGKSDLRESQRDQHVALCRPWMITGTCALGSECPDAHGSEMLRPRKYRWKDLERRAKKEGVELGTLIHECLARLEAGESPEKVRLAPLTFVALAQNLKTVPAAAAVTATAAAGRGTATAARSAGSALLPIQAPPSSSAHTPSVRAEGGEKEQESGVGPGKDLPPPRDPRDSAARAACMAEEEGGGPAGTGTGGVQEGGEGAGEPEHEGRDSFPVWLIHHESVESYLSSLNKDILLLVQGDFQAAERAKLEKEKQDQLALHQHPALQQTHPFPSQQQPTAEEQTVPSDSKLAAGGGETQNHSTSTSSHGGGTKSKTTPTPTPTPTDRAAIQNPQETPFFDHSIPPPAAGRHHEDDRAPLHPSDPSSPPRHSLTASHYHQNDGVIHPHYPPIDNRSIPHAHTKGGRFQHPPPPLSSPSPSFAPPGFETETALSHHPQHRRAHPAAPAPSFPFHPPPAPMASFASRPHPIPQDRLEGQTRHSAAAAAHASTSHFPHDQALVSPVQYTPVQSPPPVAFHATGGSTEHGFGVSSHRHHHQGGGQRVPSPPPPVVPLRCITEEPPPQQQQEKGERGRGNDHEKVDDSSLPPAFSPAPTRPAVPLESEIQLRSDRQWQNEPRDQRASVEVCAAVGSQQLPLLLPPAEQPVVVEMNYLRGGRLHVETGGKYRGEAGADEESRSGGVEGEGVPLLLNLRRTPTPSEGSGGQSVSVSVSESETARIVREGQEEVKGWTGGSSVTDRFGTSGNGTSSSSCSDPAREGERSSKGSGGSGSPQDSKFAVSCGDSAAASTPSGSGRAEEGANGFGAGGREEEQPERTRTGGESLRTK